VRPCERARNRQQQRGGTLRRLCGAWLCAWSCFACARNVLAEAPAALPSVQYEAPNACPTRDVFVEHMRARLIAAGTRVPADSALRVTLTQQAAGAQGSVEIVRAARKSQRSVAAARCEEVVEALALIAALALSERDAGAVSGQRPPARARKTDKAAVPRDDARTRPAGARARDAVEAGAEPRGEASGAERGARDQASVAERGARDEAPGAERGPRDEASGAERGARPNLDRAGEEDDASSLSRAALDSAPRDAAGVLPGSAERDAPEAESGNEAAPQERSLAADPWRFEAGIGASGIVFSGLAPALQPGLQLQAALTLRADRFAWSLQLGGRIARSDSLAAQDGDARFGFVGGVVRLCGSLPLGERRFALSACAVGEPGVFSASGDNTRNGRSHSRLWLAVGAAVEGSVRVAAWLDLRLGAELLAPVRRDRVWLAGESLYHIPALGLRLYLGLEVPFG
jgi:hypothetical protein